MNFKLYLCIYIMIIFVKIDCDNSNILIISVPKTGTHLIAKAIELITGKKLQKAIIPEEIINKGVSIISGNKLYRCHLRYNKKTKNELLKNNYKVFFIYRDPRDQIISSAHWTKKAIGIYKGLTSQQLIDFINKRTPMEVVLNYQTTNQEKINKQNFNVNKMINDLIFNVNSYYSIYLEWKNLKNICIVKFENLIGKLGGGNDVLQRKEVKKICNYLNIKSEKVIQRCIDNLYGGTFTFREGRIGSWKSYFDLYKKQLFKKYAGKLLIELGYEKDLNW